jgi:hypothetical protein
MADSLISQLVHGDEAVRSSIWKMIANNTNLYMSALLRLLNKPDLDLVRWTLWILQYSHHSPEIAIIRQKALEVMSIDNAPLQCAAVHILIHDPSGEATEALRQGLIHGAPSVRYEILTTLSRHRAIHLHRHLYEDLVILLQSQDNRHHGLILDLLAELAVPSRSVLLSLFNSQNPQQKMAAANALFKLDPSEPPYARLLLQKRILSFSLDNYTADASSVFGSLRRQPGELSRLFDELFTDPPVRNALKSLPYLLFGFRPDETKRLLTRFLHDPNMPAQIDYELTEIQTLIISSSAADLLSSVDFRDMDPFPYDATHRDLWKKFVYIAYTDLVTARRLLHQNRDFIDSFLNVIDPGFYDELGLDRLAELLDGVDWSWLDIYSLGYRIARVMLRQSADLLYALLLTPDNMTTLGLRDTRQFFLGVATGFEEVDDAGDGSYYYPISPYEEKRIWRMVANPLLNHLRSVLPTMSEADRETWVNTFGDLVIRALPDLETAYEHESEREASAFLHAVIQYVVAERAKL